MSRPKRLIILAALLVALIGLWQLAPWFGSRPSLPPASSSRPASLPATTPVAAAPTRAAKPAGRPAVEPDESWLRAARQAMGADAGDRSCGPYSMLTDLSADQIELLCDVVVAGTEALYRRRLGVDLVGRPRGAMLLFSERQEFRRFVAQVTDLPAGYAGFSRPTRGIIALPAGSDSDTLASTLAHETAHLLHRRAFGSRLPPWLSEGLADAVGDSATARGWIPLQGVEGARPAALRLLDAMDEGVDRPLSELAGLERRSFDRGVRSFDYEQSALLVRFLLLDPALAPRFRGFLDHLAAGAPYKPQELWAHLESDEVSVQERFATWLRESVRA